MGSCTVARLSYTQREERERETETGRDEKTIKETEEKERDRQRQRRSVGVIMLNGDQWLNRDKAVGAHIQSERMNGFYPDLLLKAAVGQKKDMISPVK